MKLLKIISLDGPIPSEQQLANYKHRTAARAIVFNDKKQVAVLYSEENGYYKIPGGGVDGDESLLDCLHREIREEIGAVSEIMVEVGSSIEYRNSDQLEQTSYCYIAHILGPIFRQDLTAEEISHGLKLLWLKPNEAVEKMKSTLPKNDTARFIQERDLLFLETASKLVAF